MINKTEKIQRSIRMYAITTVILIALVITVVAVYPLYYKLRDIEIRGLIFARDTSVLIVNEYVSRIKDISKQVSSRTKARMLVQDYLENKTTKREMSGFLTNILNAALKNSLQMTSITRIDNSGHVLASVGKPISGLRDNKLINNKTLTMHGPYTRGHHYYITIYSPIFSNSHKKIGTDVIIFDITDLQASIHKKVQSRLGEIIIAYVDKNKVHIFSPINSAWNNATQPGNVLSSSIVDAIQHKKSGLSKGPVNGQEVYVAYSPIHASHWGIAVVIKRIALFSSIQKILWTVIGTIFLVTFIFAYILNLALKPLSGRLIMYNKELEDAIEMRNEQLKKTNKELKLLADHDSLTSALNRRGFNEALNQKISKASRSKKEFILLYIDINKFKELNDSKGHDTGDQLLMVFTSRMQSILRTEDTIARLGGDEFAIICEAEESRSKINADFFVKRIEHALSTPLFYQQEALHFSVSIGYAIYPTNGTDIETLIKFADHAMYQNKNRA